MRNTKLQGRKGLIAGASSGIGAAIAQRFAVEGADLILTFNKNYHGMAEALRRARGLSIDAKIVNRQYDVSNPLACSPAKELGPYGITANAVAASTTATQMYRSLSAKRVNLLLSLIRRSGVRVNPVRLLTQQHTWLPKRQDLPTVKS